MKIKSISVKAEGYIQCKSDFYSTCDILSSAVEYEFNTGINVLKGEIDSGLWGISYLLSMERQKKNDFILEYEPEITINNTELISLTELLPYTCYMDLSYPLFSSDKSVESLINSGIKKNRLDYTVEQIMSLFSLTLERVKRPLKSNGNERYNAMAAVAFCHNKQVYCFPWMSKRRFEAFNNHIRGTLQTLESLNKVILLPISPA